MLVAAAQPPRPTSQLRRRRRDPSRPPKALASILRSRVIACLRAQDDMALQAAHAAVRGGVSVLEIVMSTPGVLEVVEDLRRSYPSLTFGVGTVLSVDDARKAIRAGAQFLMSPGTVMEILHELEESEVLYIPGVLTPTEIISACSAGAKIVKVYPVSVMGGEMYMSALKKPFPVLPMVASQGITIDSIKSHMEAGASAVVLSDAIFNKELMGERKFVEISELANRATLQALQSGK
ncbi:uncharacterized protein LOC100827605 isoform X2 [Brachypodium distachyon]|uniref:KHG/KDPG aldolase n=1 Tax=Brachypodium distachyon TaxID=15368 RepID=A0A0Q3NS43_BRADI|nr:uncharacterized protein LOC100827605 isoform X2 [Brachypodium distachyon]KQK20342.1 hypothetical protein BRADI_1g53910v3 [Brachypodium distachyon]|eukprot:XP_014757682.1 uncharacterized protein LOC100827605 isoform X2 [Brachypodium distachyon]